VKAKNDKDKAEAEKRKADDKLRSTDDALKSKSSEVEQCRKQKGKLEADLKRRITEKSDAQ
jgi:hypothetical protein